ELEAPPQLVRQFSGPVAKEYEAAASQRAGDSREHLVVLRRILERHARTHEKGSVRGGAQLGQTRIRGCDPGRLVGATQVRQGHEPLRVVSLPIGRLHVLCGQVVVYRRQSAGFWVSPGRDLYRRKAQARQFDRHREHPDLGVYEHVRAPIDDRLRPLVQPARSLFEAGSVRAGESGFPVVVESEVECLESETGRVQLLKPALDDRVPYRVVSEMLRDDSHTDPRALAALARWGCQALPTRPFGHDAHAKAPIPPEQRPVARLPGCSGPPPPWGAARSPSCSTLRLPPAAPCL